MLGALSGAAAGLLAGLIGIGGGIVVVPVTYYGLVASGTAGDHAEHVSSRLAQADCMRREGSRMVGIMPPNMVNGLPQAQIADWPGNSVWQHPEVGVSRIRSSASITAMSYHRSAGETTWRGVRHRVVLTLDHLPSYLAQVEGGHTRQMSDGIRPASRCAGAR